MPEALTIAGLLLVVAPLVGAIPIAYPPFLTVWSAPRERHIETVAAHRRAWAWLNAGFVLATVGTSLRFEDQVQPASSAAPIRRVGT